MAVKDIYSYTFADALIGCEASKLMNRQDLNRVASAKSLAQAASMLQDFGYDESPELEAGDTDAFIAREQNALHEKVFGTLEHPEELDFFTLPGDFLNIKVCLKSEALGRTPDASDLVSTGSIDKNSMLAWIRERNYVFMPNAMKHAIIDATDLYSRSSDPQDIDLVVDKACYKDWFPRLLTKQAMISS